jgi:cell wall-associated NlpC family hydrolase
MTEELKAQFSAYAKQEAPKEAIAYVVKDGEKMRLQFVPNTHREPNAYFELHPKYWINDALSLVHSHPNKSAKPTKVDQVMCEEMGIPWHIYSLAKDTWEFITPSGYQAPLSGREFVWGVFDCYGAVRDFYAQKLKIKLPNFYRPWKFWDQKLDLFNQYAEEGGFKRVTDLKVYDLILMSIHADVPSHCGVFVQNNLIYHHPAQRVSGVMIYDGLWLKSTCGILRHQSLC